MQARPGYSTIRQYHLHIVHQDDAGQQSPALLLSPALDNTTHPTPAFLNTGKLDSIPSLSYQTQFYAKKGLIKYDIFTAKRDKLAQKP